MVDDIKAVAQACAVCSPFSGILSEIEMFQQLTSYPIMKVFCLCLLITTAVTAYSQNAEGVRSHVSTADFGLAYPLSNDWVRATEMVRKKVESADSQNYDILLAAVYVPKSDISTTSPFFTLRAYRQPATNCKKSLEAMIASSPDKKLKEEGSVTEFSAAGRDYYRVDTPRGRGGRHLTTICTAADNHLLVWNAGAPNEEGLEAIIATLNSITPLPPRAQESAQAPGQKYGAKERDPSKPVEVQNDRVRIASGVTAGLLIKKVNPIYPADARASYIEGTVLMQAEINKSGDITDLELLDGPIELAGSAVAAVRQWKYKPYLLMGQPVTVTTQIQVNYQLHR